MSSSSMPFSSPFQIGSLTIPNRLIQGPLAGFSCAPFRQLFSHYTPPGYCVSEMLSAIDVVHKHDLNHRYLYRSPHENILCYQIAGDDPPIMAAAAKKLEKTGADLIDINCGCPKPKITKKGYGSALLSQPQKLIEIVKAVKDTITVPLTIKIRLQEQEEHDLALVKELENAGANAIIVHARKPQDDYNVPCNLQRLTKIKQTVCIPIIGNGDICDRISLTNTMHESPCDAYMISRAGTGKPWLYQTLLSSQPISISKEDKISLFLEHLQGLSQLENEHLATLQSRKLIKYYFPEHTHSPHFTSFYNTLKTLSEIKKALHFTE